MTLTDLKTKLQTITGTAINLTADNTIITADSTIVTVNDTVNAIGEVYFDWKDYLNEVRNKSYPLILWQLDGAKFTNDIRTSTIQKVKTFTFTVFALNYFDINRSDKITVWSALEIYFNVYMNAVNEMDGLQIVNIDNIKGQYAGEGLNADKEIGIMYTDVILKVWC